MDGEYRQDDNSNWRERHDYQINRPRAISLKAAALAAVATTTLSHPGFTGSAKAQVLQPVIDVCTGLSVNDSLLRDILTTTVVPTATGLETLYDELLDIEFNIGLGTIDLIDIPDVDLGIADTTAAIASGDLISVALLNEDGQVIAPGECNLTADGFTLNADGGIAIGGNQITGLGEDGVIASAGEINAIAFGDGATTEAGATGAIALGTGTQVDAVGVNSVALGNGALVTGNGSNSVALGAGSVADRGPLAGYAALGITGTSDSVGTVSVGDTGALRQITNVAPGSDATDAATVGQLQGAFDAIAAIDTTLDNVVV